MGKLSDWVRANAKEGADISEFEAMAEKLSIENIDNADKALDFIHKTDILRDGLNKQVQKSVQNHDLKFTEEKLPEILKEERAKIQNELNPPKTETEKELQAVNERLAKMELEKKTSELKLNLRGKAKELGYPEERADRFAIYGEQAETLLSEEAEFFKSHTQELTNARVKELYGDITPPKQSTADPAKTMGRDDFFNLNPQGQSEFIANGGNIID